MGTQLNAHASVGVDEHVDPSGIGLFWIAAGIIRPLGNAIRKRAFM